MDGGVIEALIQASGIIELVQLGLATALATAEPTLERVDGDNLMTVSAEAGQVRLIRRHTRAGVDRV